MTKTVGTSDLIDVWADAGAVVEPDASKIDLGWVGGEKPPHEHMNWIHNTLALALNHILQNGVPAWNAATSYVTGNLVTSGGSLYRANAASLNSAPPGATWDVLSGNFLPLTGGTLTGNTTLANAAPVFIVSETDTAKDIRLAISGGVGRLNIPENTNLLVQGSGGENVTGIQVRNDGVLVDVVDTADFPATLAANGSQELPGGYIEKWGILTDIVQSESVETTVVFPVAFPTACVGVWVQFEGDFTTSGARAPRLAGTPTASSVIIGADHTGTPITGDIYWRAIGY